MTAHGCVFCAIVASEADASIVYDDEDIVAFMDLQPVTPGHLLVVPRRHIVGLSDLDDNLGAMVWKVAQQHAAALRLSELQCEGVNLFVADGEAAFQEIFHFHLHVFPRFPGDNFRIDADWRTRDRRELDRTVATVRKGWDQLVNPSAPAHPDRANLITKSGPDPEDSRAVDTGLITEFSHRSPTRNRPIHRRQQGCSARPATEQPGPLRHAVPTRTQHHRGDERASAGSTPVRHGFLAHHRHPRSTVRHPRRVDTQNYGLKRAAADTSRCTTIRADFATGLATAQSMTARHRPPTPVGGHEKVPACGRFEVLAGGQVKVLVLRSSCRPGA